MRDTNKWLLKRHTSVAAKLLNAYTVRPTKQFKQTHYVHESYEQNRMSTEQK